MTNNEAQIPSTDVEVGNEITVKGVRMVVGMKLYEGRYNKPGAKRMTRMWGMVPQGADPLTEESKIVWIPAHVKVTRH